MCTGTCESHWFWFHLWYLDEKVVQGFKTNNWRWFCIEGLSRGSLRKYTKGNGQLLVAGKCLTLGLRGPGEKPSWGRHYRVIPGVVTLDRGPDQFPGVRPISLSH